MTEVRYTRRASKGFERLPKPRQRQVRERIEALAAGRRVDVRPLEGGRNAFRLRVGVYRVLFRREGDTLIIEDIAPRGGAY